MTGPGVWTSLFTVLSFPKPGRSRHFVEIAPSSKLRWLHFVQLEQGGGGQWEESKEMPRWLGFFNILYFLSQ